MPGPLFRHAHGILCRRDPALAARGRRPLQLDYKTAIIALLDCIYNEIRNKGRSS